MGVPLLINKTVRANIALSLAAFFWGTTFIVQRQAMDHLTPLAYGGLRFILGAAALMPLAVPRAIMHLRRADNPQHLIQIWLKGSFIAGGLLFIGISLQQYGLQWTTAGKASFITSLYVVLVPIILRFMGRAITFGAGIGAVLAVAGLYLLSFSGLTGLAPGDGLVLIGAFVWAAHVLALAQLSPRMDAIILGTGQALFCGLLSAALTCVLGQLPSSEAISSAWFDILWGGIFSVTLGFTLQVVGQQDADPAPATIILQMEAVVAAVAGWLFLNEIMTPRMITGASLMLAGMLISQLWPIIRQKKSGLPGPPP